MNNSFQGEKKCLAYIWPIENYAGKETALANVRFVTGPFKGKVAQYYMPTNIYTYYFWGVTFEVVTVNGKNTQIRKGEVVAVSWMVYENLKHCEQYKNVRILA